MAAPDARIIWDASVDPGTLQVLASQTVADDPDAIDTASLAPWLTIVKDREGEHAVLSDGRRHIRIDIAQGSLAAGLPIIFKYQLQGIASIEPKLMPLRRLADLCRHRRFASSLYPLDRRVGRWLIALRVHDAVEAGASQREIARVLFDVDIVQERHADSFRSRVRRLVAEARRLARGGYRELMKMRA